MKVDGVMEAVKKKKKKRKHGPRKIMALEQFIREMNWPR